MAATFGDVGLHKKDVAADWSPCQTDNDASTLCTLFHFLFQAELRRPEQFSNNVRRDNKFRVLSFEHSSRVFSANACKLPFQVPDAGLPRVVTNDAVQRLVLKLNLIRLQAAVLPATRNQVAARDLYLLFFGISG